MRKFLNRCIGRWDFLVYRLAYPSLNRMCRRREGWAYLFELQLRDWREQHPLDASMQKSTEWFHEAMKSLRAKGKA